MPERDEQGNRPAAATARIILARRIIRSRQALGLSRRELAERTGLSAETLARLEAGRHMPRAGTIDKLTRVFGEF